MKRPIVFAHRGASKNFPENTLPAFKKAIELGVDGIELDVQVTSDGHVVVIHDERLGRTSNGSGWVKDKTLEELKALDFGSWFSEDCKDIKIPTFIEVLELLSSWKGTLDVELKNGPIFYPGIEEKVINIIKEYSLENRTMLACFNHHSLVECKKIEPKIKTCAIYLAGIHKPWEYAKSIKAGAIQASYYNMASDIIKGCKENNIFTNFWTVDDPKEIEKSFSLNANGIITNIPDKAIEIFNKMEN